MEYTMLKKEEENKQKGIIVSFAIHALLLLLCLIPYWTAIDPPKEISGITVAFGNPIGGNSSTPVNSDNNKKVEDTKPSQEATDNSDKKSSAPTSDQENSKPKSTDAPTKDIKPVVDNSDVEVEKANQEKDANEAKATEEERLRQQAEEKARLEAQKQAEEEAKKAAFDKSKSTFSDLLGSGTGKSGNPDNEGDPNGDPNSSALDQIAKGSGRIGGGLSDRGVLFEPEINDNSQKTGKVVIKVCVNTEGKVIEAKFTQRGSTTTDKYLVDVATNAAKQYTFTPSEIATQCGSITIEFKVK